MALPGLPNEKLTRIRALFDHPKVLETCKGPISAYWLPGTDAHQSECLAKRDKRIKFLSNFSGSYAVAIITKTKAMLWTDGRYHSQAMKELEPGWSLMEEGLPHAITPVEFLVENLSPPAIVGFDPQLFTYSEALKAQRTLWYSQITTVPFSPNLIDYVWVDRPSEPINPVIALKPSEYGVDSATKISTLRAHIEKKKCSAALFTALDDIAWLLNIRGSDIPYSPVAYSIVFLTSTEVHLFINTKKILDEVRQHLSGIIVHEYNEAVEWMREWYKNEIAKKQYFRVFIADTTNFEIGSIFEETHSILAPSMIQTMKCLKNDVELSGMRHSHVIDSAVIVRFLSWLERQVADGNTVTEFSAAETIGEMRAEMLGFMGPSFETIAAVDEHAALPHYRPSSESGKREVTRNCVFLLDSGGHYRRGTTDVTRTLAFGSAITNDFKRKFTLVLKGHISTARLLFPDSIHGIRIDVIARLPLWNEGFDFAHGVGHGVGHFLNVHEGPCGIGYRSHKPEGLLHERMVLTIEPGFYYDGHWGIRIENCYEIVKAHGLCAANKPFLAFETLTYVPIQKNLILQECLTEDEVEWINNYHNVCFEKISPLLLQYGWSEEEKWLENACSPL